MPLSWLYTAMKAADCKDIEFYGYPSDRDVHVRAGVPLRQRPLTAYIESSGVFAWGDKMTVAHLCLSEGLLRFSRNHAACCKECIWTCGLKWPFEDVPGYAVADFAIDTLLPLPAEERWDMSMFFVLEWLAKWQKENDPAALRRGALSQ